MAEYQLEMYGVFRRHAQADRVTVHLVDDIDITVQTLLDSLLEQYPDMGDLLKVTACAIADELVSRDTAIRSDQTLALIPPVSGGQ